MSRGHGTQAEMLLDSCSLNATEENPKANDSPYREDIEQRVVAMVRFIRYYLVRLRHIMTTS